MKQCSRKVLALLLVVMLLISSSVSVAAQDVTGDSEGVKFSTSFEDDPEFIKSTIVKDSQGMDRTQNVSGSSAEQMYGDFTSTVITSSITGSSNFNSTEIKEKLFDNSPSSKWLTQQNTPSASSPVWVSFECQEAKAVKAYSIVSANDASERDPKSWSFYGSNDNSTWAKLDTQTGITFSSRYQQKIFIFDNTTAYKYFKLEITANNGNSAMTQFADLNIATMDKTDGDISTIPMNTVIETGPSSVWNQAANTGWTGSKALTVSGSQLKDSNAGYCYNVIYDNLSIPVTENTNLSYVIFPQYIGDYDFDYTSMHMAVDLEFSDGSFLSQSGAVDQNGNIVSPLEQGKSRTLTTRQWNKISTRLNSGSGLVGKTISKILVGYENDKTDVTKNFLSYIDDIKIENKAPKVYDHLSDYVNILRGTNDSPSFSRGLTAPAVTTPHGSNFWVPVTNSNDNKMYNYQSSVLDHIAISHEPSYWVGDRATWQFMVNTSLSAGSTDIGVSARGAKFSHDNEIAKAHYYSVQFTEGNAAGSRIEVSPTDHAAAVRYTFDNTASNRNVIFDCERAGGSLVYNSDNKSFNAVSNESSNGMQNMYIYGEFDTEFTNPTITNTKQGMVSFPSGTTSVTMKIATSFISADQAKANLTSEIGTKSFDDVYTAAQQTWDKQLGIVEIEGATEDQLITFYSCMYRLFAYPNLLSENTGSGTKDGWQYRSPYGTHQVTDGKLYYNNGFWDTYRTTWAAYALLTPSKDTEMLNGLVQHYVDQNWVPRWIAPGGTNSMVGTNSDAIFGDAAARGISFDKDDAYLASLKDGAVVSTDLTNGGRQGLENAIFDGFTSNSIGQGFSWSMESYINDYGISQLAKDRGDTDAYKYYLNRAQNYVNLFSPELNFFSGKSRSGILSVSKDDFDPTSWGGDYTETNAWNMAFYAPQDGRGLANLYGGRVKLAEKLDEFFSMNGAYNPGGYGGEIHEMKEAREIKLGQYGHSNQPSHAIPYMYDFAGRPDQTQKIVRDILSRIYVGSDFGQGYIGDEDNGEMSGWYVLSALGFYPLSMGNPEYAIGSPLFKKATIHLESGKDLVINAPENSKKNVYIQSVKLNGEDYNKLTFQHSDLAKGGTIDFAMGSTPSAWGSSVDAMPTSITKTDAVPNPIADMTSTTPEKLDAAPTQSIVSDSVYSAETSDVKNLFDNSSSTTATFVSSANGTASVYYSFASPVYPEMYTITSGTDKTNAPTAFKLYGSNDGSTWSEMDSRSNVAFDWNKYTRPFALGDDKLQNKYKHYRLDMSNGKSTIEVAELELLGDFKKSIDRDYLKNLIIQASSINATNKPQDIISELDDAVLVAKQVWNDSEATAAQIYNAAVSLKNAIEKINATVKDAYVDHFEAESYDDTKGISIDSNQSARSGQANIGGVQSGEWVEYKNVDFGEIGAGHIDISYASSNSNNEAVAGRVEVVLDSLTNQPSAKVPTHTTGSGWGNYVVEGADIAPAITGVHNVYLRFISQDGKYVANVDYIKFAENPVTIANLQAVVDKTSNLMELNYTAKSWSNLQSALTDANTVIGNSEATQDEIKQSMANLKTAIANLEYQGNAENPDFKTDIKYGSVINSNSASFQIFAKTNDDLSKVEIKKNGAAIQEYTAEDLILMDDTETTQESSQRVYNLNLDLTAAEYGDGRYDITAVKDNTNSTFSFIRDTAVPVITVNDKVLPMTVTVEDSNLGTVTVNGNLTELIDGKLSFTKAGIYKIIAVDKGGNTATATTTVDHNVYKVTAAAGAGGTITPATQYVKEGTNTSTFTITAGEGYNVSEVKVDSGAELSINEAKTTAIVKNVTGNAILTVTFTKTPTSSGSNKDETKNKTKATTIPTIISDASTGATVDVSNATIPAGVTGLSLNVTPKGSVDKEATEVDRILNTNLRIGAIGKSVLYDIKLLNQSSSPVTNFIGKVKVRLLIPQGMSGNLHVFWYDESTNALTDMGATVEGDYLTFETEHFSYYAIVKCGNALTLDTKSYVMTTKNHYEIGVKLVSAQAPTVKVYSSNSGVATVTKLKNGNYQVTGLNTGVTYIMFDVYDKTNHLLTHASTKVTVRKSGKPYGDSTRQTAIF